ncbi:lysozyme [Acidihalobacter prosperus]
MRHITLKGLSLLKQFEGYSRTVYLCPAGYPTVGFGHVVKPGEAFEAGINAGQAEDLLRQDVIMAERAVLRLIDVPLTNGQFDALVSFTYNLGVTAFQRSTLRCKVNHGEHAQVPEQLLRWVWAKGYRSRGLVLRREAEANRYCSIS